MRFPAFGQQRRSSLDEVELDTLLDEEGTLAPRSSPRKTISRLRIALAVLFLLLCAWALLSFGGGEGVATDSHRNGSNVDVFETFNISSPDGSAHASFIALGATITNLWVKDREGTFRDVVLGYDDRTQYLTDASYPYFGSVVGRYANRLRNASFSIPPTRDLSSGKIYHATPNENGNTLHGGAVGMSRSGFSLLSHSAHKLVFGLLDADGTEGFPGSVYTNVTYSLADDAKWTTRLFSRASEPTPIMLSSHVYWNLDAYAGSSTVLDHELRIRGSRFIEVDDRMIPTGVISAVAGSPMDFRTSRSIGLQLDQTSGLCGPGCTGYDNAWIYDEHGREDVVMELSKALSGIKLSIKTNQRATQVYTCNGQSSTPRKSSHGGPSFVYEKHSCVVLEQQGWIGAIREPRWGQDQIYGPEKPYEWWSEYSLSVE